MTPADDELLIAGAQGDAPATRAAGSIGEKQPLTVIQVGRGEKQETSRLVTPEGDGPNDWFS